MKALRFMIVAALTVLTAVSSVAQEKAPAKKAPRTVNELLRDLEPSHKSWSGSDHYQKRRRAVFEAAKRKEPEVLDALVRIAAEDKNSNIRDYAIDAIKGRKEKNVTDVLLRIATSDTNSNTRGKAILSLAGRADKRIFSIMVRVIETERVSGPREAAFVTLGATRDPRAYEILMDGLEDRNCAASAAVGLARLGNKEAYPEVERLYLKNLKNSTTMRNVPSALIALDTERGVKCLLTSLRNTTDRHVLREIAGLLAQHKRKDIRDAMRGLLWSERSDLRHLAVDVLSKNADALTRKILWQQYFSWEGDRAVVAQALGRMQDKESAAMLAGELMKPDVSRLRRQLVVSLGQIGGPKALRALMKELPREEDVLTKVRMLEALGKIGDERALSVVIPLVADRDFASEGPSVSAVYGFPHNTKVGHCALWVACTILDGKEPFPIDRLPHFYHNKPDSKKRFQEWLRQQQKRVDKVAEKHVRKAKHMPPMLAIAVAGGPGKIGSTPVDWRIDLTVPGVESEGIDNANTRLKPRVTPIEITLRMGGPSALAASRVVGPDGKELTKEQAMKRLKTETLVLLSVTGKMPHDRHLELMKKDTLVILLGPRDQHPALRPLGLGDLLRDRP